jgi:alginate O-acetyltransferase complex protein AlgI
VIFTEFRFLFFFLIVFLVHWSLRGLLPRKLWLFAAGLVFYGAWDWRFLGLLLFSITLDWFVALRIHAAPTRSQKRRWLTSSIVVQLGLLSVFKYLGFFVESAAELLRYLGFEAHPPALAIVLPVGISFYTFHTMSYTIDVYRGKLEPSRSFLDIAMFVTFFPALVAGPIIRAAHFLPYLRENRSFARDVNVRACLALFLVGFVKKACISDNVVQIVDPYFANPAGYDALAAWAAVLMYAVQIYCDFSGYSDMALACAGLLGYRLKLNFDYPYLSADIREFWRRWHISLSSWLKDYLYIPLGGSRGSIWFTYRNLMLTMLLGGLWHGAGWNFVIWGGLHGAALVAQREWERHGLGRAIPGAVGTLLGTLLTFWWVCFAWIFFRSQDLETALAVARSWVLFDSSGPRTFGWAPIWTFLGLAAVHAVSYLRLVQLAVDRLPAWAFALLYGALIPPALAFMNGAVQPFIYFQF